MRAITLFSLCFAGALAQDPGTVLSTMVQATTLRNTSKQTPEKLSEADRIFAAGVKARNDQSYSEAQKEFEHAILLLEGGTWTPERAWSSSLTLKLDHSIVQPGQRVTLTFGQLFETDQPLSRQPPLEISLVPALGGGSPEFLKTIGHVDPAFRDRPFTTGVTIPSVADGNYRVLAEFEGAGSKSVPVSVRRGMMARLAQAQTRAAKLPAATAELPSALGHLARIEGADHGDAGERLARLDLPGELLEAEHLLTAFERGKDPFAARYGDLEKSYRSPVDKTLQPYRLYVPATYDPGKPAPLIILLHGMGGDENTMFDQYGNGAFEKLAEKHGYLVACPKGRGPASMYMGAAEKDVLDVLADVKRAYRVDPKRVYLTGHSMGAYGTWQIAMDHPDLFAAIAPISGGGDVKQAPKLAKVPQFVVHGDADPTVPVANSRTMVEAMKKAGADVTYQEIPGGNHVNIAVPAFAPIFDFFDAHPKR